MAPIKSAPPPRLNTTGMRAALTLISLTIICVDPLFLLFVLPDHISKALYGLRETQFLFVHPYSAFQKNKCRIEMQV